MGSTGGCERMISMQFALRRRMMVAGGGGAPVSDLPLGALINVGTDGGAGAPNYEIADKDNLVSGGVVLVRKDIYSKAAYDTDYHWDYEGSNLDNLISTTIAGQLPSKLQNCLMDVTIKLYSSGTITRKMFAPTMTMLGLDISSTKYNEGKPLQFYNSDERRIKKYNNSPDWWWLSTKNDANRSYALEISKDGGLEWNVDYTYTDGVVPAFVIPADTSYKPTPNTDGSYNLIL